MYTNCYPNQKPVFYESCLAVCRSGFELQGPRYLTCRENGKLVDEKGTFTRPYCKGMDTFSFQEQLKNLLKKIIQLRIQLS